MRAHLQLKIGKVWVVRSSLGSDVPHHLPDCGVKSVRVTHYLGQWANKLVSESKLKVATWNMGTLKGQRVS